MHAPTFPILSPYKNLHLASGDQDEANLHGVWYSILMCHVAQSSKGRNGRDTQRFLFPGRGSHNNMSLPSQVGLVPQTKLAYFFWSLIPPTEDKTERTIEKARTRSQWQNLSDHKSNDFVVYNSLRNNIGECAAGIQANIRSPRFWVSNDACAVRRPFLKGPGYEAT